MITRPGSVITDVIPLRRHEWMDRMRTLLAIFLAIAPFALICCAFIPWVDSGVPFDRHERNISLTQTWMAIFIAATFLTHLASGFIANYVDRSGNALNLLTGYELIARSIKFIATFFISPRDVPPGLDLASTEFKSAWPYLLMPSWYILAYGAIAVAGLYFGGRLTSIAFGTKKIAG